MKGAKSVWGREISFESRAATSIGAAVTRQKAPSFMRKGRGNSTSYRRSKGTPPSVVIPTGAARLFPCAVFARRAAQRRNLSSISTLPAGAAFGGACPDSVGEPCSPRLLFSRRPNMFQYPEVNLVNDVIRPQMPVGRRPHGVLIPRRAFEARPPTGQRRQQELPLLRDKIPMQMRRLNVPVGTKLIQRRRIRRHAKLQKPRLIPHFDGFGKRPRRENAMPHRPNSVSGNLRANRIRNPRSKQQFLRRRNLRKRHHLIPNFFPRRIHLNRRPHHEYRRLRRRGVLDPKRRRHQQENNRQHHRGLLRPPMMLLNRVSQHSAQRRESQGEWRSHQYANHSFHRNQNQDDTQNSNGKKRHVEARPQVARAMIAVEQNRKHAQTKRQRHKKSPAVRPDHHRPQRQKEESQNGSEKYGKHNTAHRAPRNHPAQCSRPRPRRPLRIRGPLARRQRAEREKKQNIDHRNKEKHDQPHRLPRISQTTDGHGHARPQKWNRKQQQGREKLRFGIGKVIEPCRLPQRRPVVEAITVTQVGSRDQPVEIVFDRDPDKSHSCILRASDSAVPSPQVRELKRHCRPALCKSACHYALHPGRNLICRARNRDATPPPRNPAISFAQNFHHPGNPRYPKQGPAPPDLASQRHRRIRPTVSAPVAQKKLHLPHQFFPAQPKQCPHARILQRRERQPPPLQNRRQPSRDARAEAALRVKEKPPPRVPPLSVRVLTHQRNHRRPLLLSVPSVLFTL